MGSTSLKIIMATKKITELTNLATPVGADILPIVDDVAGTATTKKVTATNLMSLAPVQSVNGSTGAVTVSGTDLFSDIVSETTTARTLSDSDNGKVIVCSNAGQVIVTIPSGLTSGFNCTITQAGAGTVTIAGAGASINGFNDKTATAGQYAVVNVIPVGANAYYVDGDLTFAPLVNSYSIELDGTNDYMSISGLTSCYAFSCWIKPDSTITSSSGNAGNLLGQNSTAWFGALGGNITGDFTDEIITIRPSSQTGFAYTSNTDSIPSSAWTHIAFRWEATNSQTNPGGAGYDIFKNGTKVGNAVGTSPITSPITFSTALLGARQTSAYFFSGKIDEVGFWSSTVTEADITTMYNGGVPGNLTTLNPFGWWRMGDDDGGTGTTITDQGSGGNDGTLTNGPTFSTDIPS